MLSCCANQSCGQPLTFLAEGRLFQFQIVSISVTIDDSEEMGYDEVPNREVANFWLCGSCAATMQLVLTPYEGLRLVFLDDSMSRNPATGHGTDRSSGESIGEPQCRALLPPSVGMHQSN